MMINTHEESKLCKNNQSLAKSLKKYSTSFSPSSGRSVQCTALSTMVLPY